MIKDWNTDEPKENGIYQVLVTTCDVPEETIEDIDEYKDGYWKKYSQFVAGWQSLPRIKVWGPNYHIKK
jgi:hypothetical protein